MNNVSKQKQNNENVNLENSILNKKHWDEYYLKNISFINPKTDDLPNLFNYIDLESVDSGILKIRKIISKEEAPSRAKRVLNKEDILFQTVRPYQKNNLFFNFEDMDYVASTGYAQIRAKDFIYPMFLYYLLHTDQFVNNVLARCTGTSYPAINSNDLKKIKVKIPNIFTQQKIGNFLFILDKKIELLEKTLVLYQKNKEYYLSLFFSNENEFYGNCKKIKLNNILSLQGGFNFDSKSFKDNANIKVIKIGDIPNNLDLNKFNGNYSEQECDDKYQVSNGDIVIALSGATFGKSGLIKGNEKGFINQRVAKFICKNCDTNYIYQLINSPKFKRYLNRIPTTSAQPNISNKDILNYKTYVPIRDKQSDIGHFLNLMDNKINKTKQSVNMYNTFKRGLLQKMFV